MVVTLRVVGKPMPSKQSWAWIAHSKAEPNRVSLLWGKSEPWNSSWADAEGFPAWLWIILLGSGEVACSGCNGNKSFIPEQPDFWNREEHPQQVECRGGKWLLDWMEDSRHKRPLQSQTPSTISLRIQSLALFTPTPPLHMCGVKLLWPFEENGVFA